MGQTSIVSRQPPSRVFGSHQSGTLNARRSSARTIRSVYGRQAICQLLPVLLEFARHTEQEADVLWLEHFLGAPDALKKNPYLVLIGRDLHDPFSRIGADQLDAAVLIHEYRFAGMPTGVYVTEDANGGRNVIAPKGTRLRAAQMAVRQLMQQRAAIVFLSVTDDTSAPPLDLWDDLPGKLLTATRNRTTPALLSLGSDLNTTLASLGTRTRRNLRYYRRRAVSELGAHYVRDARPTREEFLALNRTCSHPMEAPFAEWRFRLLAESAGLEGTLCDGIRAANGEWLSLVWGHYRNGFTEVAWQMNHTSTTGHSISTALRAFLLEAEIERGTKTLHFPGGTPHSMQSAFTDTATTDVLAIRGSSLRGWLLRHFAQRLLPGANFLRGALQDDAMQWAHGRRLPRAT